MVSLLLYLYDKRHDYIYMLQQRIQSYKESSNIRPQNGPYQWIQKVNHTFIFVMNSVQTVAFFCEGTRLWYRRAYNNDYFILHTKTILAFQNPKLVYDVHIGGWPQTRTSKNLFTIVSVVSKPHETVQFKPQTGKQLLGTIH